MTLTPSLTPHRRHRVVTAFAAVVTFTVATLGFGVDGGVGASARTSSAAIAGAADRALAAYDSWQTDRNPADYVAFVQGRDATASMTATQLGVEVSALRSEWASVPVAQQQAVLAAMSQLGVPYQSLAAEPGVAFDCSGLTLWAYGRAGVEICLLYTSPSPRDA